MKKYFAVLVLLVLFGVFAVTSSRVGAEPDTLQAPKLIVVKYDADWWGVCKELEALAPELHRLLENDAVLFVTLDLTNDKTIKHTELLVSVLGIQEDWDEMGGATGLINVIDAKTKKRVAQLNVTHSADRMAEIIREHLN